MAEREKHIKHFRDLDVYKLTDSMSEASETQTWWTPLSR